MPIDRQPYNAFNGNLAERNFLDLKTAVRILFYPKAGRKIFLNSESVKG